MRVHDVMTKGAVCTRPDATLQEAAGRMKEFDCGSLPVCDNDRLVGVVTDRDITVRSVAAGHDPKADRVKDIMTPELVYCFEDQDSDCRCSTATSGWSAWCRSATWWSRPATRRRPARRSKISRRPRRTGEARNGNTRLAAVCRPRAAYCALHFPPPVGGEPSPIPSCLLGYGRVVKRFDREPERGFAVPDRLFRDGLAHPAHKSRTEERPAS
jgi:hypothetical protein